LAHIGVLRVLEEIQLPVHLLAGTSMGGIIAAAYAAGRSPDEIEQIVCSVRLLDIAQRDRTGMGLLGQAKIAGRLREALGGDLAFDQLRTPLALTAVDLETGEEVVIREGSVVEGLLATAAVPIVFAPRRWQTRWLVDGGVLNPVPFDLARQMGADQVIAVHTQHDLSVGLRGRMPSGGRGAEAVLRLLLHRAPWAPIVGVAERSNAIITRALVEQRLRQEPPDLMIEVRLRGVNLLDLDQVDRCVAAGEEAARRHLPELIALRDAALPWRWIRWWRSVMDRLTGCGRQEAKDV
jgi:NTE family protein